MGCMVGSIWASKLAAMVRGMVSPAPRPTTNANAMRLSQLNFAEEELG